MSGLFSLLKGRFIQPTNMKRILLLLLLITGNVHSQKEKFNLNFDQVEQERDLPDEWFRWGDYKIEIDKRNPYSGEYAAKISSEENMNSFGSIAYEIPANYRGSYLSLEGYIKTENISNGFAGLLIRVDGPGGSLTFDNMESQQLQGTNDWAKYKVRVRFPDEARNIIVGGILTGKGVAWFDNFTLKVNGSKNIQSLKEKPVEYKPADLDSAYAGGSQFKIENLSQLQEDRLYKLGKIWGFLKYHHPEIAKGNINWDNELFRILPSINADNFNEELAEWVSEIGEVEEGRHHLPSMEEVEHAPDYAWMYDKDFLGEILSNRLLKILKAKREKDNYYFSISPGVQNPVFKNERTYESMEWDDTGIKLLALFRYWNMMEYFNPNNHLTEKDWEDVLKEYIPCFVNENTEKAYVLNMLQLIGEVYDTHANIWSGNEVLDNFYGNKKLPVKVQFIEEKPVVVKVSEAHSLKIKKGDIITSIDGMEIEQIINENLQYYPASNYPTKLRNIAYKLLHTNKDSLEIKFENEKGSFSEIIASVDNWDDTSEPVPSHKFIKENIGYIYPASLKKGEIHDIMEKFEDTEGIVMDLRCYPSDFIVFSMSRYLMSKPTDFAKFTNTSVEDPGYFKFRKGDEIGRYLSGSYNGKLTILINEETQSQAEYTTMALRATPGAVVIGSTTAGADGNISRIALPGGINTLISGIGVYYPDGTETQRVGIIPDIEIHPSIQGFRNGEDELLHKAIEIIENSKEVTN